MTTPSGGTSGRPRWRRSALTAGVLAITAWAGVLVPVVTYGAEVDQHLLVTVCALAFPFLTTYLLGRMWTDEPYVHSARATLGRRLGAAFEILFAAAIVIGLLDIGVLAVLGAVLLCAALGTFVAALALAVPRP